jgi:hypothetical protein
VLFVGDGHYDSLTLWQALPQGVTLLARSAKNRVLYYLREWGISRAYKVYEMSRIARKPLAIELTAIPGKDKQLNGATQRFHAA